MFQDNKNAIGSLYVGKAVMFYFNLGFKTAI